MRSAPSSPDAPSLKETLLSEGAVEHAITATEADLVIYARVLDNDIASWLTETLDEEAIDDVGVTFLAAADWSPDLRGTEFALSCA